MLVAIQTGTSMATGTKRNRSATEFWHKSVNLSLKELKNIKAILFQTHERFR